MGTAVGRGVIVVVLVTCTMLVLWWVVPKPVDQGGWIVTDVFTGDSIRVTRGEEVLAVHLIGLDAPEPGSCGFEESRDYLASGIAGVDVVLIADDSVPDSDNAAQRYVELKGRDAGYEQISSGHAVADGSEHSRAARYEAETARVPQTCG